jgi:hypothetical protein
MEDEAKAKLAEKLAMEERVKVRLPMLLLLHGQPSRTCSTSIRNG